jgi:hypothetical protein
LSNRAKTLLQKTNKSRLRVTPLSNPEGRHLMDHNLGLAGGKFLLDFISTKEKLTCWQEPVFTSKQEAQLYKEDLSP